MDWPEYQRLFDSKFASCTSWKPCRIHAWLLVRPGLWSKYRYSHMNENELKEAALAFAQLPDDAGHDKAIHWAMTHERVFQLRQLGPAAEGVNTAVTANDILNPCHGQAPSKLAVAMLQQALSNVTKFFDTMLSEQKKSAAKAPATPAGGSEWDASEGSDGTFDGDEDAEI